MFQFCVELPLVLNWHTHTSVARNFALLNLFRDQLRVRRWLCPPVWIGAQLVHLITTISLSTLPARCDLWLNFIMSTECFSSGPSPVLHSSVSNCALFSALIHSTKVWARHNSKLYSFKMWAPLIIPGSESISLIYCMFVIYYLCEHFMFPRIGTTM